MKTHVILALVFALVASACAADEAAPLPANPRQPKPPEIVYMTPTAVPTLVPTVARLRPTATATQPQGSGARALPSAACESALVAHYAAASDHCLAGPMGHFCSGGLPPAVEPASEALGAPGAVAEAERIDTLRNPPLDETGGGLVWLRLEESLLANALLIGDLRLRNRSSPESGYPKWRSFTVESGGMPSDCDAAPRVGALVLQSAYGLSANLIINGVAAEINGTLVVLTQGSATSFIAIEGQALLIAFGHSVALKVGQRLNLRYEDGDWTRPASLPGEPALLDYDLIKQLPVMLFDRPLPIPQPGYAQTQGGVNMRAAPAIDARLLFQVPAGETMSVLAISSNQEWLHIRLGNGETGWMSAALLARNLGEISQLYDLTPAPPQRYGDYADLASVNVAAGGNLREAPDTAFRVKRTMPFGMKLRLLARSPYSPWVKVSAGGDTGWMALFTLQTKAVISSLPIDYQVPLPPRATPTPSFSYGGGHAYPDPEGGF